MSDWEKFSVESKIVKILEDVPFEMEHHFGRRYLTSYQIAILFYNQFTIEARNISASIGGKGFGPQDSLAKYLSGQLSRRIKNGSLNNRIEGGFLHGQNLQPLQFDDSKISFEGTTTDRYSMFRLLAD